MVFILEELTNNLIPVFCTAALNERYYGKLQGMKKRKMEEKYGTEMVAFWSCNFETGPPDGKVLKLYMSVLSPISCKKLCLQ